jgi:sigma-B regulation protein RsbQ
MNVLERNNVRISGSGTRPMLFAHGFGCDQNMWRYVAPAFEKTHRVILFDHVGSGRADPSAWNKKKYGSLQGYADDVLDICRALELSDTVFVGHSVSAMIGMLAAIREPSLFSRMVMIGPSPRYIDDQEYVGGFTRQDIEGMLESLDSNYLGWSTAMAPVIMGNGDRPELGRELANSFCQMDPEIARQFARVTFFSDNRADLPRLRTRSLVLQCSNDVIAPLSVGEYVRAHLPDSEIKVLKATGHCPNLSAPEETIDAMRAFV